jgi:translation elongation factor EF-4
MCSYLTTMRLLLSDPQCFSYSLLFIVCSYLTTIRSRLSKHQCGSSFLFINQAGDSVARQVSPAMGFGFRCGFLGLLHMEIVQERLEREYDLDLIITAPTVVYNCVQADGNVVRVDNPSTLPEDRKEIQEPYVRWVLLLAPALLRSFSFTRSSCSLPGRSCHPPFYRLVPCCHLTRSQVPWLPAL